MTTTTERIAIAIAEEYPDQREAAAQLAEHLEVIAHCDRIPTTALLAWIRDRPRHNLSSFDFRNWCARYMLKGDRAER